MMFDRQVPVRIISAIISTVRANTTLLLTWVAYGMAHTFVNQRMYTGMTLVELRGI